MGEWRAGGRVRRAVAVGGGAVTLVVAALLGGAAQAVTSTATATADESAATTAPADVRTSAQPVIAVEPLSISYTPEGDVRSGDEITAHVRGLVPASRPRCGGPPSSTASARSAR